MAFHFHTARRRFLIDLGRALRENPGVQAARVVDREIGGVFEANPPWVGPRRDPELGFKLAGACRVSQIDTGIKMAIDDLPVGG